MVSTLVTRRRLVVHSLALFLPAPDILKPGPTASTNALQISFTFASLALFPPAPDILKSGPTAPTSAPQISLTLPKRGDTCLLSFKTTLSPEICSFPARIGQQHANGMDNDTPLREAENAQASISSQDPSETVPRSRNDKWDAYKDEIYRV